MKLNRCKNTLDLYIVMDRNFRLVNNAEIVGCALILVLTRVDSHVNNLITNIDGRDLRMLCSLFLHLILPHATSDSLEADSPNILLLLLSIQ